MLCNRTVYTNVSLPKICIMGEWPPLHVARWLPPRFLLKTVYCCDELMRLKLPQLKTVGLRSTRSLFYSEHVRVPFRLSCPLRLTNRFSHAQSPSNLNVLKLKLGNVWASILGVLGQGSLPGFIPFTRA